MYDEVRNTALGTRGMTVGLPREPEVHDTVLGTQQSRGDDVQMGSNICYGHAGGIELETNTCYRQSRHAQLGTRTQDIQ